MEVKSKVKWLGLALAAIVLVAAGWWLAGKQSSGRVLGANTDYQAVFLTNGQVYFGKLSDTNQSWVKLTNIYYLQVTTPLQQTAGTDGKDQNVNSSSSNPGTNPNLQLVKLGSELHGPQDTMYIERDKILFWEEMKNDSKVVQAIKQYNK